MLEGVQRGLRHIGRSRGAQSEAPVLRRELGAALSTSRTGRAHVRWLCRRQWEKPVREQAAGGL